MADRNKERSSEIFFLKNDESDAIVNLWKFRRDNRHPFSIASIPFDQTGQHLSQASFRIVSNMRLSELSEIKIYDATKCFPTEDFP